MDPEVKGFAAVILAVGISAALVAGAAWLGSTYGYRDYYAAQYVKMEYVGPVQGLPAACPK